MLSGGAAGQTRLGSIGGSVQDGAGLRVDGARITVVNRATGVSRSVESSAGGRYRIVALDFGVYTVRVEAAGFAAEVLAEVPLHVDREVELRHVLQLAGAQASITVVSEAQTVDASLSGLASLIEGDTIREQPLNGRDYLRLALLQPGVLESRGKNSGNNTGYGLQLSIGGSRPVQNNFRMDGVSLSDFTGSSIGSVTGVNLGVDTLSEFSVLTNGFSAEYGRAAGGVVNAVTRSGGNSLHGTLSYFHRNDNLDARNPFDPATQPEFRRHQYGATAGGPIRKNKSFFFAGWESLRQVRGNTAISTTLSDAARSGFAGGSRVAIDPQIAAVLPFFPRPNGEVSGDTGLFRYTNNTVAEESFATGRWDHNFSEKWRVFARYSFDDATRLSATAFQVGRAQTSTRPQSFALEETRLISPALVNSLRFGVTRALSINNLTAAGDPALDDKKFIFVPGARAMGRIDAVGLSLFPGGSGSDDFDKHAFTSFQVYDDVSYTRGRHFLKMGFMMERTRLNADSQSLNAGEFRFPSVRDFLVNVSDRFRALMPGSDTVRGFRQWLGAWYLQDRWQISPRLSLELGVRHEWITVPTEVNGKLSNLDTLLSSDLRVGQPLFNNPSRLNFAPRAGLSWNVRGSTVLRASYGIYFDQLLSPYLLISGFRNPPFYLSASLLSVAAGRFPQNAYQEILSAARVDRRAERLPRNPAQPYVQQWHFGVEQRMGKLGSLRLSYAGSHGLHLSGLVEDANLAPFVTLPDGRIFFPANGAKQNPNFSMIRDRIFEGHSFYNSLQVGWTLALGRKLQAQVSYVLSKNIDDDSSSFSQSEGENSIGIPVSGNSRFNRGLSNYDQRQNLVVSMSWDLGKPAARMLRPFFAGWRLSSILTCSTGNPFSVTLAYDAARTLTARPDRRGGQRPDVAPGFSGSVITGNPEAWFDKAAFQRPMDGFLGNLGRNTLSGPGRFSTDVSLAKRVLKWKERVLLDLRLEAFNLQNRSNFNLPAAERTQLFTRTGIREDAGRITSAAPGREVQLGIRVQF